MHGSSHASGEHIMVGNHERMDFRFIPHASGEHVKRVETIDRQGGSSPREREH